MYPIVRILSSRFFTLNDPIWGDDLGTEAKNDFFSFWSWFRCILGFKRVSSVQKIFFSKLGQN
jgi:hypothetical protein